MEIKVIHILLVEDNVIVRKVVEKSLKSFFNANVKIVESGNEAINLLQFGNNFDLIISDYCMQDGNGADLLNFIYSKKLNIPFALFTTLDEPDLPKTDKHFLGVINKLKIKELMEIILNFIQKSHQQYLG